jgi:hypothetical protein
MGTGIVFSVQDEKFAQKSVSINQNPETESMQKSGSAQRFHHEIESRRPFAIRANQPIHNIQRNLPRIFAVRLMRNQCLKFVTNSCFNRTCTQTVFEIDEKIFKKKLALI